MTKLRVVTVILAALATGLILGGSSFAQSSACLSDTNPDEHHPWGRPDGTPASNELIIHHDYELSQNTTTKFADWVAYFLDGSTFPGDDRSRNYRLDPCVDPGNQVSDDGYDGAYGEYGYDRGHLAPLATFEASEHWDEVNFMTNIAPMHQTLNRGVWAQLEGAIRDIASPEDSAYYVLTGTAYDESMPELPNASVSHRVPSAYWKIVATADSENPNNFHATAFLFDQHGCVVDEGCTFNRQYRENRVAVDEVEDLAGFDFFSELPDAREMEIESRVGAWPPGSMNGGPDGDVVIGEILPNPSGPEPANEWIKVCNNGSEEQDISGWTISDGEGSYGFPEGTVLAPEGEDGDCHKVEGSTYNPTGDDGELTLANSGDEVTLYDDNGNMADMCAYDDADEEVPIPC